MNDVPEALRQNDDLPRDAAQGLADWLKHMQTVNHSLRHVPEMAAHIEDLKRWERMVRAWRK